VANWFIENLPGTDPLKLQKLIYYVHGWHLAIKNGPLIDDFVQAWKYGSVIPAVYHEFKGYGNDAIPRKALGTILERDADGDMAFVVPRIPPEDKQTQEFLKKIAEIFGQYTGLRLSAFTHQPGTPWFKIMKQNPNRKGVNIPDNEIQKYFEDVAQRQHG
jgi:uncharacterized phage-associated protein